MFAIVLEAPHRLALCDVAPPPPPGPGEAQVRVRRVGVCGTDLHAFLGEQAFMAYPVVLGHELAVEVTSLGRGSEGAGVGVGDVCTVVPYVDDQGCSACRRGLPNCCEALEVLGVHRDGGMTEVLNVPARLLIGANDLPLDTVALVEMLAIGAHAARRADLGPEDDVAVLGAGPIGLSALAFARGAARRTVLVEINPRRLDALSALGVAEALDGRAHEGLADALRDRLGGDLPTVVMDATGSARSMEAAVSLVAHGGRLVLIGHTPGTLHFENPDMHRRELTLLCSRNATRADFEAVLEAVRDGAVDPRPWITTRASPAALVGELPAWTRPEAGVLKAVLDIA